MYFWCISPKRNRTVLLSLTHRAYLHPQQVQVGCLSVVSFMLMMGLSTWIWVYFSSVMLTGWFEEFGEQGEGGSLHVRQPLVRHLKTDLQTWWERPSWPPSAVAADTQFFTPRSAVWTVWTCTGPDNNDGTPWTACLMLRLRFTEKLAEPMAAWWMTANSCCDKFSCGARWSERAAVLFLISLYYRDTEHTSPQTRHSTYIILITKRADMLRSVFALSKCL